MSASRKVLLFFILLFARAVSADGGDDFANNLFSDLGPLLALFGERVTMQFISGSMGWADNIILAMAPLGIITAIVGAIRVGGPSWLKAVIGRARENLAVAEAELMSSTSQEVCELWNGQEVVRCMGSPSVTEFICLLPENQPAGQGSPEIKVDKELSALDDRDKYLERIDLNIHADIGRLRASRSHPSDKVSEDTATLRSDEMIIIKRNVSLDAPNISLNTHRQSSRSELRVLAAFGTILQLGVLVYSGFATYHPTLKFPKNDNLIAGYAYPCAATGTFILVVGMMLCGHVVESSTVEKRFQAKPDTKKRVRMVWLQRTKTVSDQVFGSFAIYAEDDQAFITTSRRSQKDEARQSQMSTEDGQYSVSKGSNHSPASRTRHSTAAGTAASPSLQLKTVLGTMTTLTGFVLQFVGLRGLHWSASIGQLGAVFLMVCLKAWVRRGLATPPNAISLPPGYELEWFAKTLGKVEQAPWNSVSKPDEEYARKLNKLASSLDRKADGATIKSSENDSDSQWTIASTGEVYLGYWPRRKNQCEEQNERQIRTSSEDFICTYPDSSASVYHAVSNAQTVLNIRKYLGHLAEWHGPASAEAVSLARAIEITMNTLVGSSAFHVNNTSTDSLHSGETFYWSLDASYDGGDCLPINFKIQRQTSGKWKAYANEYEAALSLWLSSVNDKKGTVELPRRAKRIEDAIDNEDDTRLRMDESKGTQGLRLLGLHTPALQQDLRWWVPKDLLHLFRVQETEHGWREIENHRIVGYVQKRAGDGINQQGLTRYACGDVVDEDESDDEDDETAEDEGAVIEDITPEVYLAAYSYSSLPLLFAQHMFSAFMRAVTSAERPELLQETVADVLPETFDAGTWKSFNLQNANLSAMVREIEETGLGSLGDIYLSVIPPLSEANKLPRAADAIITLARDQAKQHEQLQHWKEATEIYLWLFRTANKFKREDLVAKATAVLMEYLRQVSSTIELRKGKDHLHSDHSFEMGAAKLKVEKELGKSVHSNVVLFESISFLNESKGLKWQCPESWGLQSVWHPGHTDILLDLYLLHLRVLFGNPPDDTENWKWDSQTANVKDVQHWTPLHYAVRKGASGTVNKLFDGEVDVNSRDLAEWTPLHYACHSSKQREKDDEEMNLIIYKLIDEGADVNAQGKDGMTPLHCATIEGNGMAVSVLVEAGAKVDSQDVAGTTPLLWAAYKGWMSIVKSLCQVANKRLRDHQGRTVVHLAALSGNASVVEWLITEERQDKNARDRKRRTPLHWAVLYEQEETTILLTTAGADRGAQDAEGHTPLHYAVTVGQRLLMTPLIEGGTELEFRNVEGQTPLHIAANKGKKETLELLLKYGADIEARDAKVMTPLHHAADCGQEKAVELLIEHGAEKEVQNCFGCTPLHLAVGRKHEKVIASLIDNGANLEAKDENGRTALHTALESGNDAIVALLIQKGADKEAKSKYGDTPLHEAIRWGSQTLIDLLIQQGADKEARNRDGNTALHLAIERKDEATLKYLIEQGADKEARDNHNRTPLHKALERNNDEARALLFMQQGAKIDVADDKGRTPLHIAVKQGHRHSVELLLGQNVDLEARDRPREYGIEKGHGLTPLHYAARSGQQHIMQLLIDAGAKTDASDWLNPSRLSLAVAESHIGVAKQLINKGSDVNEKTLDGVPLLHIAIENADSYFVRLLIDCGADRTSEDSQGKTAQQKAFDMWREFDELRRDATEWRRGREVDLKAEVEEIMAILE